MNPSQPAANTTTAPKLHTVAFNDVGGNGHILRKVTLAEAHGRIGSHWPCIVDGEEGHFLYPTALPVFVKNKHGEAITTDLQFFKIPMFRTAPELLSLLQSVYLAMHSNHPAERLAELDERISAAIAKATGKAVAEK